MRYILDNEGYIYNVSFGAEISCSLGDCTEYTGEVPADYETLEEWHDAEIERLNAWKIVEGNLVFDANKYDEIQSRIAIEAEENSHVTHKEIEAFRVEQDENLKELYDEQSIENSSVIRLNTIDNTSNLKVEKVDIRANSGITDSIKLFLTNANMLPNELIDGVSDEVTFRPNDDRSIDISSSIHNVASGESIHLENTIYHDVNSISLKGRSTQATRSGYNCYINSSNLTQGASNVSDAMETLLNYEGYDKVIHIKQAVDYATLLDNILNDYYIANVVAGSSITCMWLMKIPSGITPTVYVTNNTTTYYASLTKYKEAGNGWAYYYATYTFKDTATSFTLLPHFKTKISGEVYVAKMQVTVGSEIKDFEEYGASPSPDYPSPIESITEISATVTGKNLFDGTGWRPVQSGDGFPKPATGATIVSSDANNISFTSEQSTYAGVESGFINVKANETYMFSATFTTPSNRFFITQYDENKTRISTLNYINVSTLQNTSFTTTNDGYITIAFTNTTKEQTTYKIENIQLEKGRSTQATTYEPYQSNTSSIDLQGNELCSLPNGTKDELVIENGIAKIIKRIGKVVLDGSESWRKAQIGTTGKYYFTFVPSWGQQTTNGKLLYCDYFVPSNTWSEQVVGMWLDTNMIIKTQGSLDNTEDLTSFKTWLSTHNTEVYYALAEPETINLGTVEMPHTYEVISNVSNSENTDMEIEYYSKNVEYNLAGTSSNVESIMYFIANENYYLNGLIKDVSIRFYDFDGTDRTLIGEYSDKDSINFSEDKKVTQITLNVAVGMPIEKTIYPMLQPADQLDIDSGELKQYMAYKGNVLNVNLNNSNIEFIPGDQLIIESGKAEIIKQRFLHEQEILYTSSDGEISLYFQFPEELYKTLPSEETTIVQFGTVNPKIYISDKKIYLEYINSEGSTETISLYDKENNINLTEYVMNLGSVEHITATIVNYNSRSLDYISSKKFDTWETITLNNLTMPSTYYRTTNIYTDKIALTSIQYRNIEKMNTQKVKIGTFEIFEDRLLSDIIPKLDFTEEDMTKVRNYILSKGTLTYTEKLLYDLNEDGVVNAKDLLIMSKMIKCNVTTTEHGTLEINSKDPQRTILLKDKDGNEVVNLNMLGITTPNLQVGNIDFLEHQSLLWEGGLFMHGTQTITLSEKVSEQVNGIVLVFSEYASGAAQDYNFSFHFVPKEFVSLYSGYGSSFFLNNSKFGLVSSKYLYIRDDEISGNAANIETGTGASGIKYTNNRWVLRAVIGV